MVGTIVAAKALESATDDQGLINQAFKLTILIGLALAVGIGIYLIWTLTDIFTGIVGNIGDVVGNVVSFPGVIFTAILSAIPGGRVWGNFINR